MNWHQRLIAELLLDLCLRMDPIVGEVRLRGPVDQSMKLMEAASERLPLELAEKADQDLPTVEFAIGPSDVNFVDASDWRVWFNLPAPASAGRYPTGAAFAALEAAKHLFLAATAKVCEKQSDELVWPSKGVFDTWQWRWRSADVAEPVVPARGAEAVLALVGCGGVGASYLWFLKSTGLHGRLTLIDDDVIAWHNMNRLPFATIADADVGRLKVKSAADFMSGAWDVRCVPKQAQHEDSVTALQVVLSEGGLLAVAVGEPETRRFLGRRSFEQLFDAGTNTDGSAQVLTLRAGLSTCIECHTRSRHTPSGQGCGVLQTSTFAGVVPHLAAYAGVMLGREHLVALLGGQVLHGANTQSIMRQIDETTRESTRPCRGCPHARN
jgi:hypothetical protein